MVEEIGALCDKLRSLKRKLGEANLSEENFLRRTKIRLEQAAMCGAADDLWDNMRVDRLLVDYMLREDFFATAKKIAEDSMLLVRRKWGVHSTSDGSTCGCILCRMWLILSSSLRCAKCWRS